MTQSKHMIAIQERLRFLKHSPNYNDLYKATLAKNVLVHFGLPVTYTSIEKTEARIDAMFRPESNKSHLRRWVIEQDLKHPNKKLFTTNNSYRVGEWQKEYTPTAVFQSLINRTIEELQDTNEPEDIHVVFDFERISDLPFESRFITARHRILSNVTHKVLNNLYVVVISRDTNFREYNFFTTIPKEIRLCSNYNKEYDISSAQQALSIWFIKQLKIRTGVNYGDFPLTEEYIKNKSQIRESLAKELNTSIDTIKEQITALYYGGDVRYEFKDNLYLQSLKREARSISKIIADNWQQITHDSEVIAEMQEKIDNRKVTASGRKKPKNGVIGHYFLSYYESKIMQILDKDRIGIRVHDAVYFETVPADIDQRILKVQEIYEVSVATPTSPTKDAK